MYNILLVEDSATDRCLIEGLLTRRVYFDIETAEDGVIALKKMQTKTPDVVVTDMQMPNMNGLQLVDKIRTLYPLVPVILITGDGSEDLAARALQRGAAGYVPKSRCDELLNDTVEHVINLTRTESSFERIIDCATLCHFEFAFPNDFALIQPLLELAQRMCVGMQICDEPGAVQVSVALEHAINNAIYHGNLEIGSTTAADQALMKQRMTLLPYKNRQVHVEIAINRNEAKFLVRDDGPGFNVREVAANGRKTALIGESGRGLFLMWAFMDNITFDQKGNAVVMVKRKALEASTPLQSNAKAVSLPRVMGRLTTRDGSPPIELTKNRMTVGRDSSCDVVLRSASVSGHHCLLYTYQGWWYVRDLKSTNGIRINHVNFNEHLLRPGCHLTVGKYEFTIDYDPYELGAEGMDPPADPF